MTTIDYKDSVVAYDSRATESSTGHIIDDNIQKRISVDKLHFFPCGALAYMDMGHSAVDAIKGAMKRDANTGGQIRTFGIE